MSRPERIGRFLIQAGEVLAEGFGELQRGSGSPRSLRAKTSAERLDIDTLRDHAFLAQSQGDADWASESTESLSCRGGTVGLVPAHDLLFYRGDLRAALQQQEQDLVQEVERAPEEHVLQVDEDAWARALAERWSVATPELHPKDAWMDMAKDVQVDVSWDHFRRAITDPSRPAYVPGHRTAVHIPFTGDKTIFSLKPSSYDLNPPRADVADTELRLVIEYPSDTPADIKGESNDLVNQVTKYLGFADKDIEQYNRGLEGKARAAIQSRRQRVERHRAHIQATGLPVGPPSERPKTYIAEALVRRPAPVLPTTPAAEPIRLEPVLADEVFEHILEVIRLQTVGIERSPQTYAAMGEEALRTVLLDALNTHYRGQGTAEAFNFAGKTDILIRHEGNNLFIGECKFWSGVKGFVAAIDQLLGYTAWRDTKLALIMFVRERALTAIIQKTRAELAEHGQFVASRESMNDAELHAVMSLPSDYRRHADLNVFFVPTPSD